jgi:hypothetical protein
MTLRIPLINTPRLDLRLRYGILRKGGALPPGNIRVWGGREYVKVAPGDWRLYVESAGEDGNRLTETEMEKTMNNYDLKRVCYSYAKDNFQGKTFVNKETGRAISVSRSGIGEWRAKSKSREQILSIKILDKLLENARHDHDASDEANRLDIEKISYFRCQCKINSENKEAIITVRNIRNEGDKYYHHYLDDIKIEPCAGLSRPAR